MAENAYDVVIADMVMPSGKEAGLGVLRAAKQKDSLTQVIVLTGYGNVSNAVESMRAGAIHYLEKRAEEGVEFDILHEQVKEAILRRILLRYVHDVYKSLAQMRSGLSGISSQVQEYSALLDTVARTKDQVLGPLGVKPESGN
jgi:DNA-binding NtrC family response regulator